MNALKMTVALLVLAGWMASANAADNKKLLVGKWEAVKVGENSPLPKGTLIEHKADGTMSVTVKKGDKDAVTEGTYKVNDDDSYTVTLKRNGKEQMRKITIKKLTEEELEASDPDGHVIVFKKVK